MDKNTLRMIMVLSIISMIVGLALANVYKVTSPLIEARRKETIKEAIINVLPEAKNYKQKKISGITVYQGEKNEGEIIGYAFISEGSGYQGAISLMAGANKDLTKLTGIYIMDQVETPGLGGRISEKQFQSQFEGLNITNKIEYVKNKEPEKDNEIQAITGATISSKSVVENLNGTLAKVRKGL